MEDEIIWTGVVVDGRTHRVRVFAEASPPDAIVEYQKGDEWEAEESDALCSEAYMTAMFAFRGLVEGYMIAFQCRGGPPSATMV